MYKKIYVYRLTDAEGNQDFVVVDEVSDNGRIGGYDKQGIYQQYDSQQLYYAYEWAEEHGMKLEFGSFEIDLNPSIITFK